MLWILQDDFSQDWDFKPSCFYKCSPDHDKDKKEMLDRYAVKVAGEDPGKYGYVEIEGDGNVDTGDNHIVFCCDSEEILEFVYRCVADSFLFHPGVIDLRGVKGIYDIRIM